MTSSMKLNAPLALAALAMALALTPAVGHATPNCTGTSYLMQWPSAANPVWEMCWVRPSQSSGTNGSGLEIHDVYYKGKLVFKRAHVPILNVLYAPGGCGCYRDWSYQERAFQADNEIFPGYAEPTSPPVMPCDNGGTDVGSFSGVAAEKIPSLILTTQYQAGWYRYKQVWQFDGDGTITPSFGFGAVAASCISFDHVHHDYWRFDFDIDGAGGDAVYEGVDGGRRPTKFAKEDVRKKDDIPGTYWQVVDVASGLGYSITPGPNDEPADSFAVADAWILAYHPSEIDDNGQPGPACAIKMSGFVNNESVYDTDIVFWYGGHAAHPANQVGYCAIVGPTLKPIGSW